MGLIFALFTSGCATTAVSLGRRHGVLTVNTQKLQIPLLRQGTEFVLSAGDKVVDYAEKQGVDVNALLGVKKKADGPKH